MANSFQPLGSSVLPLERRPNGRRDAIPPPGPGGQHHPQRAALRSTPKARLVRSEEPAWNGSDVEDSSQLVDLEEHSGSLGQTKRVSLGIGYVDLK